MGIVCDVEDGPGDYDRFVTDCARIDPDGNVIEELEYPEVRGSPNAPLDPRSLEAELVELHAS